MAINGAKIDKLERTVKEAIMAGQWYYPGFYQDGLRKKLGENYVSCGMKSTNMKSRIMITFIYALKTLL
jgi:hypothetical protein